jgi:hypothetical protein
MNIVQFRIIDIVIGDGGRGGLRPERGHRLLVTLTNRQVGWMMLAAARPRFHEKWRQHIELAFGAP